MHWHLHPEAKHAYMQVTRALRLGAKKLDEAAKRAIKAADTFCAGLGLSPQARPSRPVAAEVGLCCYFGRCCCQLS